MAELDGGADRREEPSDGTTVGANETKRQQRNYLFRAYERPRKQTKLWRQGPNQHGSPTESRPIHSASLKNDTQLVLE